MYPKIKLQVVSDVSEQRRFTDRATNQSRDYVVRNLSGIVQDDSGSAIVSCSVPERVTFPALPVGSVVIVPFSHFESRKGIWECTVASAPEVV